MQLNELKRLHKNKKSQRVARGGKRGKTAGRGTKGQKARAGHRLRPELRDIIKKYPKHRGYKFKSIATKPTPINLDILESTFNAGDAVNPEVLLAKKLINKVGGRLPKVKVLAKGKLTKAITLSGCLVSEAAQKAIEAAKGSVEAVAGK
jgi:large subunit ribosomal protein L15